MEGKRPGRLYFMRNTKTGSVKVGFTNGDPDDRRKALQTGSDGPLELVVAVPAWPEDEVHHHWLLQSERVLGEWFSGPITEGHIQAARERLVSECLFCKAKGSDEPLDGEVVQWLSDDPSKTTCSELIMFCRSVWCQARLEGIRAFLHDIDMRKIRARIRRNHP